MPLTNDQLAVFIERLVEEKTTAQTAHFDAQMKELKDKVDPMYSDYKNAKFMGRMVFGLGVIFGGSVVTWMFDLVRGYVK